VPVEAWRWLIGRVKERDPSALVVAEAYENLGGLLGAGFDAVYHDEAYDFLKEIYQGHRPLDAIDALLRDRSDDERKRYVYYLENHDERRIASPLVRHGGADETGFGSAAAGRQLAPVLYLATAGPVLLYNGQEVGEDGSGDEGFGGEDGRSSIFDYWGLPSLAALSNGKRWDGGGLSTEQSSLRSYYRDLLKLGQDPSVAGPGYWALRHANPQAPSLLAFARFAPGSGRLLVVAANFQPGGALSTALRLPAALLERAGIDGAARLRRVLDEGGAAGDDLGTWTPATLATGGFPITLPDQSARVFVLER
jgi:hypothetical protein